MPEQKTIRRAQRDKREGKSASTQAGEFIREEIEHIRDGKHGARSTKQAIAIGLSKARRAGVDLPPPKKGEASEATRERAARDRKKGHGVIKKRKTSARRSRAATKALANETAAAASPTALARHARKAAKKRTKRERSASAKKAAETKGPVKRRAAAKKAATTKGPAKRRAAAKKAATTRARKAA